jgi:hypothetical protein
VAKHGHLFSHCEPLGSEGPVRWHAGGGVLPEDGIKLIRFTTRN